MADPARILQEALTLEPPDRARVARQLIESLEEADDDAGDLWRAEVRRRVDEIEAGTACESWDSVRQTLRSAIKP